MVYITSKNLFKVKTGVNYTFENSANLAYEADHVRNCLLEGRLESLNISLDESLLIAELMESVRKQVGVSYHQDWLLKEIFLESAFLSKKDQRIGFTLYVNKIWHCLRPSWIGIENNNRWVFIKYIVKSVWI